MSGSELSSTYSETLVRVQTKGFVRLANDSGGPALVTFIWSADNRDAILFTVTMGDKAEIWMFGHDLLRQGVLSTEEIGEGLVAVNTAADLTRVTLRSPENSKSWMRVHVNKVDVSRILSAIDSRMLNAPTPDIEAEIVAWFNEEGEES